MLKAVLIVILVFGWLNCHNFEVQKFVGSEVGGDIDKETIALYEQIITIVIRREEFAAQRQELCAEVEAFADSTTNEVLWVRCKSKTGSVWFEFQARGNIFGVVESDGSTMYDWGSNGKIDSASTADHQRVYTYCPTPKLSTGERYKSDWQKQFEKRIRSAIEQNPSLKKLGFSFFYLYKST